ncbi:U-scoloptoxin(11)-Ssd2a-like isoform X2 [Pollicipes pollicipes]|uniref:U-scoloptoxin(11)-Ssd2a-like isoform X2 n=1 Tax=Pollicipes pollicipes TaxID=41117 RepID=UPI0018856EBD|nr:U-scoloptoxin(11)-Ssd2a-like isoform X2 [Pollicipes pollicipes]
MAPLPLELALLLAAVVAAAGYGRLRPEQNGRLFNGVYFVYEGKTSRESDLAPCPAGTSVCSLVHLRFWLPVLSQRLCRCQQGQCPYQWSDQDGKTLLLNNRIQMKFCEPVAALPACPAEPAPSATLERRRDSSALDLEERRDVRVHCSCTYPSGHALMSEETGQVDTQLLTVYTCRRLQPCLPSESCGAIRMDTYSTYYTCSCPAGQLCLFKEEYRKKVKRDVHQLFYSGRAYVGECRAVHR